MRLKTCIALILLAQAMLLGHILLQTQTAPDAAVTARGGEVTLMQVTPTPPWGGVYGGLQANGEPIVAIVAGELKRTEIYYDDEDNECGRTELIAARTPVHASEVGPVDRFYADNAMGVSSLHGFSVMQMYDELHTYDLAGNQVQLWSTKTRGLTGDFIQGVGLARGELVFVTKTKRNAQSFNGEPAAYQFLLPPGPWHITYDETDECVLLDEYMTEEQTTTPRLDASIPQRVCLEQENSLYAVEVSARVFCSPQEIGRWYCKPQEGVAARVLQGGSELLSTTTGASGAISFTPTSTQQYSIELQKGNQTLRRYFSAEECLPHGMLLTEGRTQVQPRVNITAPEETTRPRTEEPAVSARLIMIEYMLILVLTVLAIILATIAYYKEHKDDRAFLLRLRIWIAERL